MAKKGKARRAARQVRDRWRQKQWYTIRAPKLFNGRELGATLADDPEKLHGRTVETTLKDLTGDFSKMHVKIAFRVAGHRGNEAYTKFWGHELTSDYTRRLTRRKQSKVDDVVDVVTQDGYKIRVKPLIVTDRRCQSSQRRAIRTLTRAEIQKAAKGVSMGQFIHDAVVGDLASNAYQQARKIHPIKRVEIRRTEILAEPEALDPATDVFPEKTLEEEAAEAEKLAAEQAAAEAEAAEAAEEAVPEAEVDEAPAEPEPEPEEEAEEVAEEPEEEAPEAVEADAEAEEELEEPAEAE